MKKPIFRKSLILTSIFIFFGLSDSSFACRDSFVCFDPDCPGYQAFMRGLDQGQDLFQADLDIQYSIMQQFQPPAPFQQPHRRFSPPALPVSSASSFNPALAFPPVDNPRVIPDPIPGLDVPAPTVKRNQMYLEARNELLEGPLRQDLQPVNDPLLQDQEQKLPQQRGFLVNKRPKTSHPQKDEQKVQVQVNDQQMQGQAPFPVPAFEMSEQQLQNYIQTQPQQAVGYLKSRVDSELSSGANLSPKYLLPMVDLILAGTKPVNLHDIEERKYLELAVEQRHPEAPKALGRMYLYGIGGATDVDKAIAYVDQYSKDNANDAFALAELIQSDLIAHPLLPNNFPAIGARRDEYAVKQFYIRAFNLGHLGAQQALSAKYEVGNVPYNFYHERRDFFKDLMSKGVNDARRGYIEVLDPSKESLKDVEKILKAAAASGQTAAKFKYGSMLVKVRGGKAKVSPARFGLGLQYLKEASIDGNVAASQLLISSLQTAKARGIQINFQNYANELIQAVNQGDNLQLRTDLLTLIDEGKILIDIGRIEDWVSVIANSPNDFRKPQSIRVLAKHYQSINTETSKNKLLTLILSPSVPFASIFPQIEDGLALLKWASSQGNQEAFKRLMSAILDAHTKNVQINYQNYADELVRFSNVPELDPKSDQVKSLLVKLLSEGKIFLDIGQIETWLLTGATSPQNPSKAACVSQLVQYYQFGNFKDKLLSLMLNSAVEINDSLLGTLTQLAHEGSEKAHKRLVNYYLKANTTQDDPVIKEYLKTRAFSGDESAKVGVINYFAKGTGAYADKNEAKTFLMHFANKGDLGSKGLLGSILAKEVQTREQGIGMLQDVLTAVYNPSVRTFAARTMLDLESEIPRNLLLGVNVTKITPRVEDKVQFAHYCKLPVNDRFGLFPAQDNLRINEVRLGDLGPNIGFGPFVDSITFYSKMDSTILMVEPGDEGQKQIAKAHTSLDPYFNQNTVIAAKFRYVANHILSIADQAEQTAQMMTFVTNLQTCRTGADEAVEYSFNRNISALLGHNFGSYGFNPLLDSLIRQIKTDMVEQKLLMDPYIAQSLRGVQNPQNQRVHLTKAMRNILGKELGLWLQGQKFEKDPLQTVDIQRAFTAINIPNCEDWKLYLMREFSSHYTPRTLIAKLTESLNIWLKQDNSNYLKLTDMFRDGGIYQMNESLYDTTELVLTPEGTKQLLMAYHYLEQDVFAIPSSSSSLPLPLPSLSQPTRFAQPQAQDQDLQFLDQGVQFQPILPQHFGIGIGAPPQPGFGVGDQQQGMGFDPAPGAGDQGPLHFDFE